MAAARLLVIDDDENNRDMPARRLERRGYAVDLAVDGTDALNKMKRADGQGGYDLLLLDIMMPGISGLDVLRQLRLTHPATELPIIMATAKSDREDIVEALALGANDYVTKPLDFPVVVARVENALSHKRAVERILALERDLAQQNKQLQEHNARMHGELQLAARMQQSLLPPAGLRIEGLNFAWNYLPCDELGGDILNILPLGREHVAFYLLDVSGHGVQAALLSVTLSRILAPVAGQASLVEVQGAGGMVPAPPRQVLEELNVRFQMTAENVQYFTLIYGVLNRSTRELQFSVAGHPPAMHLSAAGEIRELDFPGLPIGFDPKPEYEQHSVVLAPGERLLLYSDGVTESTNDSDEQFGPERLAAELGRHLRMPLDQTLSGIRTTLESFAQNTRIRDDVSLLALEVV